MKPKQLYLDDYRRSVATGMTRRAAKIVGRRPGRPCRMGIGAGQIFMTLNATTQPRFAYNIHIWEEF